MQEAVLSSRIEGTQATLGEVLEFEAGSEPHEEAKRVDIHEILNYRNALMLAERRLKKRPFNLNLLLELHRVLLDSVRGRDKARGQFRSQQNWIGRPGCSMEEADFVPPRPLLVKEFLDNWEKFYHSECSDLLVQLALVHAQFEIIHPCMDGNGRLGRILIPLFLYEKSLLSRPVFYLSGYFEQNRDAYIDRLRHIGKEPDAWNRWIEFFLEAVIKQAQQNTATALSIIRLYEKLKTRILTLTRSQYAIPLLDILFEKPVFSTSKLDQRNGMPSKPMILRMLNKLRDDGILTIFREASGRQSQIMIFPELINLCEGKNVVTRKRRDQTSFTDVTLG
jgi:Fic family protein